MSSLKSKYIDLEFVNVTNPLGRRDLFHQTTVRKHVMLRYWHERKKELKSPDSYGPRRLLPAENESEVACVRERAKIFLSTIGNPQDKLGSGERDPFASYPVPAAPYIDALLRNCKTYSLLASIFATTI